MKKKVTKRVHKDGMNKCIHPYEVKIAEQYYFRLMNIERVQRNAQECQILIPDSSHLKDTEECDSKGRTEGSACVCNVLYPKIDSRDTGVNYVIFIITEKY